MHSWTIETATAVERGLIVTACVIAEAGKPPYLMRRTKLQ